MWKVEMGMREIKFRAWDAVNKMWLKITGFETHVSDDGKTASINTGLAGMFHDGDYIGTFQKHGGEQNNVILMQYTGLKDANGIEIFEGDIIKFTNCIDEVYEEIGTVVFDLDECGYKAQYSKGSTVHCIYLISPKVFSDRFHEVIYEIIGNIYENPELLEVKGNE